MKLLASIVLLPFFLSTADAAPNIAARTPQTNTLAVICEIIKSLHLNLGVCDTSKRNEVRVPQSDGSPFREVARALGIDLSFIYRTSERRVRRHDPLLVETTDGIRELFHYYGLDYLLDGDIKEPIPTGISVTPSPVPTHAVLLSRSSQPLGDLFNLLGDLKEIAAIDASLLAQFLRALAGIKPPPSATSGVSVSVAPPTPPPISLPVLPPISLPTLPPISLPTLPPTSLPTLPPISLPTLPPISLPTLPPVSLPVSLVTTLPALPPINPPPLPPRSEPLDRRDTFSGKKYVISNFAASVGNFHVRELRGTGRVFPSHNQASAISYLADQLATSITTAPGGSFFGRSVGGGWTWNGYLLNGCLYHQLPYKLLFALFYDAILEATDENYLSFQIYDNSGKIIGAFSVFPSNANSSILNQNNGK